MSRRHAHAVAAPPAPIDLNPRLDTPLDFEPRSFGKLVPQDYAELGFMCGLEVHQQLDTRRKLFCRCPAGLRMARVDGEILRHMRPTLSELGKYDGCALMEFKTRKEIVYRLDRRCVCTYELDDTPPFEIDPQAVKIALEIARLYDMALVSELQVMRKQYLDGSIPTGFQRTSVIAVGGALPLRESELGRDQMLGLRQLTLEEDSCREVSDVGHRITFQTDRLGTPLTEIVTEPDLLTPFDVAAGGRLLARVARASGKVRRGIGAARQDVNVSIAGSRRVELKGVPRLRSLPRLVHVEALRHLELLKLRHELLERGLTHDMFATPVDRAPWNAELCVDARPDLKHSAYPPVRDALARGDFVAAVKLPRFAGLLGRRTQPRVAFFHEFVDRVRVIACLTSQPFMIGSHVPDYGVSASEWTRLHRALRAGDDDSVVIVWGPEDDAETAVREILIRAQDALVGVPSETRQAFDDGTTGLERILPGPERMYPDTDTPPVPIPDEWVETIETSLAERPWERAERYVAQGLPEDLARRMSAQRWADLYDALAPTRDVTRRRLAYALEKRVPHQQRHGRLDGLPDAARIAPLVDAMDRGLILAQTFESVFDALVEREDDATTIIAEFVPSEQETVAAQFARMLPLPKLRSRAPTFESRVRFAMGVLRPHFLQHERAADVLASVTAKLQSDEDGAS